MNDGLQFLNSILRIFDEFRDTHVKYKNRVRSRIQNLKDTRNPQLRQNVLVGLIQPEKMASMTSEVRTVLNNYAQGSVVLNKSPFSCLAFKYQALLPLFWQ